MVNHSSFKLLGEDEYLNLLAAARSKDESLRISPYQEPRFLKARRLFDGKVRYAAFRSGTDNVTAAGFIFEDDAWVAHEGPALGNSAVELIQATSDHTAEPVWMTVPCGEIAERLENSDGLFYATRVINLRQGLACVHEQFTPDCRRALRRFERSPLSAVRLSASAALNRLDRILEAFARPETRSHLPLEQFGRLVECLFLKDAAQAVLISEGEQVVAAAVMLMSPTTCNLRYLSLRRDIDLSIIRQRPGNGLVWECIAACAESHLGFFDLSGVTLEQLTGSPNSIDRFKAGFGGSLWGFRKVSNGCQKALQV
jgi:Acetyltransferase (GNAT) domain